MKFRFALAFVLTCAIFAPASRAQSPACIQITDRIPVLGVSTPIWMNGAIDLSLGYALADGSYLFPQVSVRLTVISGNVSWCAPPGVYSAHYTVNKSAPLSGTTQSDQYWTVPGSGGPYTVQNIASQQPTTPNVSVPLSALAPNLSATAPLNFNPTTGALSCLTCLVSGNNLSDLSSASTARTNLGLAAVAASGSASDLTTGTLGSARLPGFAGGDVTSSAGSAVLTVATVGASTAANIHQAEQDINAILSPGGAASNLALGIGAVNNNSTTEAVALGVGAQTSLNLTVQCNGFGTFGGIAIGYNANSNCRNNVVVGQGSEMSGADSIGIGAVVAGLCVDSILEGTATTDNPLNAGCHAGQAYGNHAATGYGLGQVVFGGDVSVLYGGVSDLFIGPPMTNWSNAGLTPGSVTLTLHASGGGLGYNDSGSGLNIAGSNLQLAGGQGSGSAAGGSVILSTAPGGSSGTAQNALVQQLTISSAGVFTFVPLGAGLAHFSSSGVLTSGAANLANADVTGNLPVSHLNSGASASATTFWRGDATWATAVSSVGLSLPSVFTVSGTPVTSSGTLTATLNGSTFQVLQSGGWGEPTASVTIAYGALVDGDCKVVATATLTGAVAGDLLDDSMNPAPVAGVYHRADVTAANTVSFTVCNFSEASWSVPSTTYVAGIKR